VFECLVKVAKFQLASGENATHLHKYGAAQKTSPGVILVKFIAAEEKDWPLVSGYRKFPCAELFLDAIGM
jgi:hypothetical protein